MKRLGRDALSEELFYIRFSRFMFSRIKNHGINCNSRLVYFYIYAVNIIRKERKCASSQS